jgi:hypothetical protein
MACARSAPTVDQTQTTGGAVNASPAAGGDSPDPEMSREPREPKDGGELLYTPWDRAASEQRYSSELPGGAPPGADVPPHYTNPEPVQIAPSRTSAGGTDH